MNYLCIVGTLLIAVCFGAKVLEGVKWAQLLFALMWSIVPSVIWTVAWVFYFGEKKGWLP